MAPEVLLIQRCPIVWLLPLLCRPRAEVDQCDAGLIHVLHQATVFSCIICLTGMLDLLTYTTAAPCQSRMERKKAMMCHAHTSVGATDRGIFAAAADADIIDVIVQVWQQSQLSRGCLAPSLSTLQGYP